MRCMLVFFLLLCFQDLKAQETAQGYYITLNNDTVYSTYKIKTTPGFFTPGDNLYEQLPVGTGGKERVKFKPTEIKGYFIEWNDANAHFISMSIRNGKQKFLRVLLRSSQLSIYEYSIPTRNGTVMQFALHRPGADTLYVGPDDGNQKTKRRLKEFFAGMNDILSIFPTIKELFTRPGLVQYDMTRLVERILERYKE
jgi:hypothetical protein